MRPLPFKHEVSRQYPGGFLLPVYRPSEDFLRSHNPKRLLMVTSEAPPSMKQAALYWSILNKIVENHGFYYDADVLNQAVKFGIGYVDVWVDHEMNMHTELRSNARIERNFEDYKIFFDRAMDFLFTHIMPGMRREVIREVESWMGLTLADARKGNRGKATGEMYDGQ